MNQPELLDARSGRLRRWLVFAIVFIVVMAVVAMVGDDEERWARALLLHLFRALFRGIQ